MPLLWWSAGGEKKNKLAKSSVWQLCGSGRTAVSELRENNTQRCWRNILGHLIKNGLRVVHFFHLLLVCVLVASCFDSTLPCPRTEMHAHAVLPHCCSKWRCRAVVIVAMWNRLKGTACLFTHSWLSNSNATRGSTQNTAELYIVGCGLNGRGSLAQRPERLERFEKHGVSALHVWNHFPLAKYHFAQRRFCFFTSIPFLFYDLKKRKTSRLSEWMLCLSLIPLCKHGLLTQLTAVHVRPASLRRSVQCA